MRRRTFKKVAVSTAGVAGTIALLASIAPPSHAQAVQPNTIFGCNMPGTERREDPFGAGTQSANALIATPDFPTVVPTQANLAYFSTVGPQSGQARCMIVSRRLNALNASPALVPAPIGTGTAAYQFDVAVADNGLPVICFRQVGGICADLIEPGLAPLPDLGPFQGYLVMTLAHDDTPAAEALARLNTNLSAFAVTAPGTPNIDDSSLD